MTPGHRTRLLELAVEGVKLGQLVWASEMLLSSAGAGRNSLPLWLDVRNLWNGDFWLPLDLMERALDLLETLAFMGGVTAPWMEDEFREILNDRFERLHERET